MTEKTEVRPTMQHDELIKRLRAYKPYNKGNDGPLGQEAATALTDLAAENARLREANREWADANVKPDGWEHPDVAAERTAKEAAEARLAKAMEALEAVRPLVDACYEEMHGPACDDEPDDEPVATGLNGDGSSYKSPVTFGHIRRARAAMAKET